MASRAAQKRRFYRPRPKWFGEVTDKDLKELTQINDRLEALRRVMAPLIKRQRSIREKYVKPKKKKPRPLVQQSLF